MYFCHSCQRFYRPVASTESIVQCETCQSPLIEVVQGRAHREELEVLARHHRQWQQQERQQQQQQRQQQGQLPGPLWEMLSQVQSTLLNAFGDQVMMEITVGEMPGSVGRTGPSVDEVMHSFVTFPHGMHDSDRIGHPEAFVESSCRICLDPIVGGSEPVVMLPCRHCYHSNCIKPWLHERMCCPLCRASVLPPSAEAGGNNTEDESVYDSL